MSNNTDKQRTGGSNKESAFHPQTLAVRAGQQRTGEGEHSEALFLTSSFVFENAQQAQARMAAGEEGNVYSRYTNPTVRNFEQRLAALEQAEDAIATSSGMSAILSICMAFLKAGDHILCSRDVFGSTTILLTKYMEKFGVQVSFVSLTDTAAWESGCQQNTKLLFVETPSNPLNEIASIEWLGVLAKKHGAKLVVDNCFCTPALQQPLTLGADIVMHSATKYIDGQGRVLGGAAAGSSEDINEIRGFVRACGPALSPFNAWVLLKGLETLSLRMSAHSASALELATWLNQQPQVSKVYYCGLDSHPNHSTAKQQQSGFGGLLSFQINGDQAAAWRVIDSMQLLSLTPNLGDAKSTVIHPATTTHGRLSTEQQVAAGIADNLIRISVGLEHSQDIQRDIKAALAHS